MQLHSPRNNKGSAFKLRPLAVEGSKLFGAKGDPIRTEAWERAWKEFKYCDSS
jgi:hypothetical protein